MVLRAASSLAPLPPGEGEETGEGGAVAIDPHPLPSPFQGEGTSDAVAKIIFGSGLALRSDPLEKGVAECAVFALSNVAQIA
jgi:hypothetical protein